MTISGGPLFRLYSDNSRDLHLFHTCDHTLNFIFHLQHSNFGYNLPSFQIPWPLNPTVAVIYSYGGFRPLTAFFFSLKFIISIDIIPFSVVYHIYIAFVKILNSASSRSSHVLCKEHQIGMRTKRKVRTLTMEGGGDAASALHDVTPRAQKGS